MGTHRRLVPVAGIAKQRGDMKSIIIGVICGTALSCPALAQSCSGSSNALSVVQWSAKEASSSGLRATDFSVTLRNEMEHDFRLIDATIRLSDALGGSLGSIGVERTTTAGSGDTFVEAGTYSGTSLFTITRMHPDDVRITTCTRAIVTSDGEAITAPRAKGLGEPATVESTETARNAMIRCWNPPVAALTAEGLTVKLSIELDRDGSVIGTPQILSAITDDLVRATALSAQRAVQQCSPYTELMESSNENWQELTIIFDSSAL